MTLAGHSYGAWIAAHYAARRPDRLGHLVLLDPTQVFAGLRPGYVLRALPVLVRPTPERVRSFLDWECRGAALDPAWLRLQEEGAGFPAVRPVTGPRPDLAGLARSSGARPGSTSSSPGSPAATTPAARPGRRARRCRARASTYCPGSRTTRCR